MHNKEIKTCGTTGTSQTLRHKDHIATHIARKIQNTHNRGSQTQQYIMRKRSSCLIQQDPNICPKRPTHKHIPASLFRRPKLPPGNPELIVDVEEETTCVLGVVLL